MRATTVVVFLRCIGSLGVGTYLGAALAGLIAVVTGRVFAAGSTWAPALPVLTVLGAVLTAAAFAATRGWMLPTIHQHRRRWLWGAVAGVVLGPLAIAIGDLGGLLQPVGLPLILLCAVTTLVRWMRWYRETHLSGNVRRATTAVPRRRDNQARAR
jgi:hypothetical protein